MTDFSNPSRFPKPAAQGIEDRREVPHTGPGTPPEAFESLARTQQHLERMLGKEPDCTIVVGGQTLPASRGFKPQIVFRNA
mgnify:CR=1 FL=1